MKQILDAWARWLLVLAFDFWRYPDAVKKEEKGRPD